MDYKIRRVSDGLQDQTDKWRVICPDWEVTDYKIRQGSDILQDDMGKWKILGPDGEVTD